MDTISAVLWLSVILQAVAAIMALRLIPLTGRAIAWLLFSIVFVLMALRRTISLLHEAGVIPDPRQLVALIEPVALLISVLLVIAVYLIRRIFIERDHAQHLLEKQIEELRRFQRLTVGRELRMKELKEENKRLMDELKEKNDDIDDKF